MNKLWKQVERRVANFFHTQRNPLSGAGAKHSSSDTLHPRLYIEIKHRKQLSVWSLYKEVTKLAKKENKIPVLVQHEKGMEGFLITVHSSNLYYFFNAVMKDSQEYRRQALQENEGE